MLARDRCLEHTVTCIIRIEVFWTLSSADRSSR